MLFFSFFSFLRSEYTEGMMRRRERSDPACLLFVCSDWSATSQHPAPKKKKKSKRGDDEPEHTHKNSLFFPTQKEMFCFVFSLPILRIILLTRSLVVWSALLWSDGSIAGQRRQSKHAAHPDPHSALLRLMPPPSPDCHCSSSSEQTDLHHLRTTSFFLQSSQIKDEKFSALNSVSSEGKKTCLLGATL